MQLKLHDISSANVILLPQTSHTTVIPNVSLHRNPKSESSGLKPNAICHQTNGLITILDCCDGYERNLTSGGCEPRCTQGCLGGKCTAPNQCTCLPGWFPQEGVCMPYCDGPCQRDAYCFSPNVCACKLGYDEVNGECRPICPGGCKNGDCVAPRLCRCKPGFALQPSTDSSGIETKRCVPVCETCRNGECTAPGVCSCREGLVFGAL